MTRTRRGLLALLLAIVTLTTVVASPARAGSRWPIQATTSSDYGGVPWRWLSSVPCRFGAIGRSIGSNRITASAWYGDCKPSNYKGICARLWREDWQESPNGQLVLAHRYLVGQECDNGGAASSGAVVGPKQFGCGSGLYSVTALFLASAAPYSEEIRSPPFQCVI